METTYAQNREDIMIKTYFDMKYGKDFKGHLLDLGANDGITFSNSLMLIEGGWSADLVEPSPKTYAKLAELHSARKDVKCHQIAISNVNGTVKFHDSGTLLKGNDESLVSTLVPKEKLRWNGAVEYKEIAVESVTFSNLLNLTKKGTFDFITIDIEGLDWIVLNQIDLTEVGCKMLIIENNGKEALKYVSYCKKFGLKLITSNQENLIFGL